MSTTRLASLFISLVSLFATSACMEEPLDAGSEPAVDAGPPVEPDTHVAGDWTLQRTCTTRRSCADERSECISAQASSCVTTCRTACSGGSGCSRCLDFCGDRFDCRTCAGTDGECMAWNYEFSRVNAMPDPAIQAACSALVSACPATSFFSAGVCTTFAANENAAVAIPAYECFARTTCTPDSGCSPAPDFATADRVCPFSSDPERDLCDGWGESLAYDAPWWLPSTVDAALLCATQPLGMRAPCVEALVTFLRVPS